MRRTVFLFLLAAASASAQIQPSTGCPVNLFAQRQSMPAMLNAGGASKDGPSQGLHVTLTRTGNPAIESVEATLHGLSPDPRIVPVVTSNTGDITKTFHLQRNSGEPSLASFDLSMSRVGALRWVDVTSITYADGTSWQSPRASLCRAIPSPLVLVAGH
jgi:hypothetical protein